MIKPSTKISTITAAENRFILGTNVKTPYIRERTLRVLASLFYTSEHRTETPFATIIVDLWVFTPFNMRVKTFLHFEGPFFSHIQETISRTISIQGRS